MRIVLLPVDETTRNMNKQLITLPHGRHRQPRFVGRLVSWLMILPLLLSVASCSTDETADVAGEQWVVTAIMGANGLGDRSYSDLIYSGLCQSENALDITLRVIVPTSYEEAEPYYQTSVKDIITDMRLEYACKLLEETDYVLEYIATEASFGASRTFYRAFKNKYNLTPTEYRKLSRKKEG